MGKLKKWSKYLQILHCRSDINVRVLKEECCNNYQQEFHGKRYCNWHKNPVMLHWIAENQHAVHPRGQQ